MGRYIHRPLYSVDYGEVETVGSGVVLGDNNDNTFKRYFQDAGSIQTYPAFPTVGAIPVGRDIIAVRNAHRQRNTGLLGLYNGWVMSYLRVGGKKEPSTRTYVQDGYNDDARTIEGPALYNKNLAPWLPADITAMGSETGAAVGEIGPNKGNRWCVCSESFIIAVYDDPVPVPTTPYPANNQTIDTSSVNFSAVMPAPQPEQPVQAIFQVARDSGFTNDVRTFAPAANELVQSTAAGTRSYYNSVLLDDSKWTNLGPGQWYLRMKGRDYRGKESAWGAVTTFNIVHTALPVPSPTEPAGSSTVATPYAKRTATLSTTPSGGRKVGITYQLSKQSDFSGAVVQWTNTADGVKVVSPSLPAVIGYDPTPNPAVVPGKQGNTVSVEDPSQYTSQGVWYYRVRATDTYGQSGAWSSSIAFTVSHRPIPANVFPSGGKSFDQDLQMVTWDFTDPWSGDTQSAYQMRVLDNANTVIQDTGKLNSSLPRADMNIPASWMHQMMKIGVRIWDADDVASLTEYQSTFRLSVAPIITMPFPAADSAIITGQPNITWSCVFARPELTQKSFRIKFTNRLDSKIAFDSGTIVSTATAYMPPTPILKNLSGYQISLTVTDSEDLSRTLIRNFSTNFERPEFVPATSDASDYNANGFVTVNFPNGNPDPQFLEWRIYHRKHSAYDENEWQLAGTVSDPDTREFRDWMIAGNGEFDLSVTQAAYRFGSIVESSQDEFVQPVYIFSDKYWLISPEDSSLNIKLHNVNADKFTDEREFNQYTIMNGGRRTIFGTKMGKTGNLTCQIRHNQQKGASEQVDDLMSLADHNSVVFLKDPFGNVTPVALGNIGVDRIPGVGTSEFADVDIPYAEVIDTTGGKIVNTVAIYGIIDGGAP
ncbi:minor tail protein [Gordonia phage RobinSparkles]|nr:minor tail protein [Gordonia phage RobinSparkles]